MRRIFHIVTPPRWDSFASHDFYEADSLLSEGFIHCSFENQLEGVIGRYYRNEKELLLLEIDPALLTSELKEEASTNGELYPHIYGTINKHAVVGIRRWKR
jgi:uncharacterized protein (DUF952 family)